MLFPEAEFSFLDVGGGKIILQQHMQDVFCCCFLISSPQNKFQDL